MAIEMDVSRESKESERIGNTVSGLQRSYDYSRPQDVCAWIWMPGCECDFG